MSAGLSAKNLGKKFPGVVALNGVNLDIVPGKVTALVGANGAGKSTLIKILTGYYSSYEGEVTIDGRMVALTSPRRARDVGIGAVYQEVDTALVPSLTVTENVLIEQLADPRASVTFNWGALHRQASHILQSVGLSLDVTQRAQELMLHQKQLLLIARAVSQNIRYLIFDEPTTSLGLPEVQRLFEVIRTLKTRRIGIIYISHRLNEVRDIADRVVVLRGGEKVADFHVNSHNGNNDQPDKSTQSPAFDPARITEAMLGLPVNETYPAKAKPADQPRITVLEARGITRGNVLDQVSFTAHQGEILGITGLVGAGKTELLRALFGADRIDTGTILLNTVPLRLRSPHDAVQRGIYLVPEERRSQGILIEDSVRKNLSLPFLSQFAWLGGWMQIGKERSHSFNVIKQLGLAPADPERRLAEFSGGNQQKVAIGKWFGSNPRVIMFDEATQGIDVRAKRDIYQLVRDLSQSAAVIYASSDMDEVVGLADRVLVMRDGRICADLTGAALDRAAIFDYAIGSTSAVGYVHQLQAADTESQNHD